MDGGFWIWTLAAAAGYGLAGEREQAGNCRNIASQLSPFSYLSVTHILAGTHPPSNCHVEEGCQLARGSISPANLEMPRGIKSDTRPSLCSAMMLVLNDSS